MTAWRRLNLLFEWMPMGALINGCILGVHGGIGRHLRSPEEIGALQRPLRMGGPDASLLLDLLWSDPTSSDSVTGVHTNEERGAPVVCYGPDRVASFLEVNNLSLIVRAHECVMDGFQRFAGGRLITVFSATNYCNRWANAGAILVVGKELEITPKIIYPLDDLEDVWLDAAEPKAPRADGAGGGSSTAEEADDADLKDMRPPTPPRDIAESESPRSGRHRSLMAQVAGPLPSPQLHSADSPCSGRGTATDASMGPPPPRPASSASSPADTSGQHGSRSDA